MAPPGPVHHVHRGPPLRAAVNRAQGRRRAEGRNQGGGGRLGRTEGRGGRPGGIGNRSKGRREGWALGQEEEDVSGDPRDGEKDAWVG